MEALNNQGLKKQNDLLETSRAAVLHLGYRFIEMKSRLKKKIKDSSQLTGASNDYKSIIPSAVKGQRGRKSF